MYRIRLLFVWVLIISLSTAAAYSAQHNETFTLTASDAALSDWFGSSVSIHGNKALVGSRFDDDGGINSGSAYVYDVTTGDELLKLTASDDDEFDLFGASVDHSGDIAVIGARGNDINGIQTTGSAYVFDLSTGSELFTLTATHPTKFDWFGEAVAISGATAIIGASGDDDRGNSAGAAYVFDATTGNQLYKLTATDASSADLFGSSVGVDGTLALVGAPLSDDRGNNAGSAYLFDLTGGQQLFQLSGADTAAGDFFGNSVSVDENTVIVGAPQNDEAGIDAGAAYVFDAVTGAELYKLTASDAGANDKFGRAVAISGDRAIVTALNDSNYGSAYVFDLTTGLELFKLTITRGDRSVYGASVDLDGDSAIVGVNNSDRGNGSVYVFDSIPEPGTAGLIAVGLPCLLRRRGPHLVGCSN